MVSRNSNLEDKEFYNFFHAKIRPLIVEEKIFEGEKISLFLVKISKFIPRTRALKLKKERDKIV